MTDLHTYTSTSGTKLSIRLREQDVLAHGSTRLFLGVDDSGMFIPTADLLAVIDAADPDAMRAYLRETIEREVPARVPAGPAADHFDYLAAEVPEADSPEDVDELPDVEQARAAGEQIGKIMRAFGDAYAEAMKR